jgi:DNA mismatch repair protein MutL
MSRRIHILPDAVADQIAAGEVVERPASVVKELAENALDAGATLVRITAEQGGRTRIEVADDGHGMERDDAVLALDRHATSKIASAADLVGVSTFGFRGEALPAIASVSRFSLLTSDGASATAIQVTGGRIDQVEPAARTRGTTVTVRSLFFNTPARRKFLRSASSESRAIVEAVATLALTYPAVAFELEMDGVRRLHVPMGQSQAERVESVWGRDLAGTLVPVSHAVGGFQVEGFVQRPGDARPTGRRVQLFINGRPFRDPFLVRAAEAGYRAAIHPGDRPSLLLMLATSATDVDVNVHPAKLEVRFRDRLGAERAVEEAVRLAIGQRAAAVPVGDWRPMPSASFDPGDLRPTAGLFDESPSDEEGETGAGPARDGDVALRQFFRSFIVYESGDSVVFVDQHSAHERVLYEEVMAHLREGGAASQRLLLPVTIELTDEELDAVDHHHEFLERTGFAVESFGGRSVILQAVPAPHPRFDAELCFRELVADLARGRFGGWSSALERFAATYACRAAVKAGEPLAADEMRTLLARLHGTVLPPHDVHGRATIVQLPREELERRFGRR